MDPSRPKPHHQHPPKPQTLTPTYPPTPPADRGTPHHLCHRPRPRRRRRHPLHAHQRRRGDGGGDGAHWGRAGGARCGGDAGGAGVVRGAALEQGDGCGLVGGAAWVVGACVCVMPCGSWCWVWALF